MPQRSLTLLQLSSLASQAGLRSPVIFRALFLCSLLAGLPVHVHAQMGGAGMGGGNAGAPPAEEKPKFREHVHNIEGLPIHREKGDAIVKSVRVIGNRAVGIHKITSKLQTRKSRFYDYELVLGDVRRLNDMGSFDHVTFKIDEQPDGVDVTYIVNERPMITRVIYHGNRAMGEREVKGRCGISKGDPLSEFSIESARRRLIDYYLSEGFNQISITSVIGIEGDPGAVVYRINEGPKERIASIHIHGSTIVSEARLKKIINSRGPMAGVLTYIGNAVDMRKIDQDVDVLATYYHNLGFLTATVGRQIKYDDSGKWLTVNFVVNEGPRFKVNDIQVIGNQYITEQSLRQRMNLKPGDMFDGTLMRSRAITEGVVAVACTQQCHHR